MILFLVALCFLGNNAIDFILSVAHMFPLARVASTQPSATQRSL